MLAAWIHRPNVKVLADGFHMFKEGESMNNIRRAGELAHTHIATLEGRRYPLERDPRLEEFFQALVDKGIRWPDEHRRGHGQSGRGRSSSPCHAPRTGGIGGGEIVDTRKGGVGK
ncbi:MAG: hypothetical protein ACLR23_05365 [Clostridia bacterium]